MKHAPRSLATLALVGVVLAMAGAGAALGNEPTPMGLVVDGANCLSTHTELASDIAERRVDFGTMPNKNLSDLNYLCICKFGCVMTPPSALSTLNEHITGIIEGRTTKQVVRAYASWVVAVMEDLNVAWYWTRNRLIHPTMSGHTPPCVYGVKSAVSFWADGSNP